MGIVDTRHRHARPRWLVTRSEALYQKRITMCNTTSPALTWMAGSFPHVSAARGRRLAEYPWFDFVTAAVDKTKFAPLALWIMGASIEKPALYP